MSAVINLTDLIDLAVGSQNVSEVNFKVLQTTLQAIVQHLNIQDTKIEFRGADSINIQEILKNVRDERLKEIPLNIVPDELKKESTLEQIGSDSTTESAKKRKSESIEDIVIVEAGKVREPTKRKMITPAYLARLEAKVKALQGQIETLGSQVLPSDESLLQTARLQQDSKPISDLLQSLNITKRMSGAEEGIDRLASLLETVAKEYADLKTVIDRLEDELGQDMVETMKQIKLAANYAKQIRPREEIYHHLLDKVPKPAATKVVQRPIEIPPSSDQSETSLLRNQGRADSKTSVQVGTERETQKQAGGGIRPQRQSPKAPEDMDRRSELDAGSLAEAQRVEASMQTKKELEPKVATVSGPEWVDDQTGSIMGPPPEGQHARSSVESQMLFEVIPPIPRGEPVERTKINNLLAQHEYMRKNMEFLTAQVNELVDFNDKQLPSLLRLPGKKDKLVAGREEDSSNLDETRIKSLGISLGKEVAQYDEKMKDMENRIAKHSSKLKRQDVMLNDKTTELDKRLSSLSNALSTVFDAMTTSQNDDKQDVNVIENLMAKVQHMEDALVEVGCTAQDLQNDKDFKTELLQKMSNDLELVKTSKADRYEIEDIFAEKADCYTVLEKVSQDAFDLACHDLGKGIDEALNRVSAQESLLAATMLEVQNTIDNKFNREDIEPMKEELMHHIDAINKKLDRISGMKQGKLAAAAKKKYLTDVNCISCDRNVSMKIDNDVPCIPAIGELPMGKSIAPYVAYELDHLRRMKAKSPGPRTIIEFEELARRYKIKKLESYEDLLNVPHLQNRYCGGSHTKLGPQQRVTHVGHFDIVRSVH